MKITEYQFGRMVIDDTVFTHDLILLPDQIVSDWWRQEGHKLRPQDLEIILHHRPRQLVIGTGSSGMMVVTNEALEVLSEQSIDVLVEPTNKAWKTFNHLSGPNVVGAFHLTC